MQMILAIAAGGAVGAVLRHYLNSFAATLLGTGFPYGIFAANILGSFLMGVLIVYFALAGEGTQTMKASFLTVGLLGAFTTFSTFSLDAALEFADEAKRRYGVELRGTTAASDADKARLLADADVRAAPRIAHLPGPRVHREEDAKRRHERVQRGAGHHDVGRGRPAGRGGRHPRACFARSCQDP